jgi:hypothetical protein
VAEWWRVLLSSAVGPTGGSRIPAGRNIAAANRLRQPHQYKASAGDHANETRIQSWGSCGVEIGSGPRPRNDQKEGQGTSVIKFKSYTIRASKECKSACKYDPLLKEISVQNCPTICVKKAGFLAEEPERDNSGIKTITSRIFLFLRVASLFRWLQTKPLPALPAPVSSRCVEVTTRLVTSFEVGQ